MADPVSVNDIDHTPPAGKTYFNLDPEWREEFIYFLLIDRFQDDAIRPVVTGAGRSAGIATPNNFYGGTHQRRDPASRLHRRPRLHCSIRPPAGRAC
jgi:hypothetical protein